MQGILAECDAADAAEGGPAPHPKYADNKEIAYVVMDFLFASQDASTASLIWTLTLMAEHPEARAALRRAFWGLFHGVWGGCAGVVLWGFRVWGFGVGFKGRGAVGWGF